MPKLSLSGHKESSTGDYQSDDDLSVVLDTCNCLMFNKTRERKTEGVLNRGARKRWRNECVAVFSGDGSFRFVAVCAFTQSPFIVVWMRYQKRVGDGWLITQLSFDRACRAVV